MRDSRRRNQFIDVRTIISHLKRDGKDTLGYCDMLEWLSSNKVVRQGIEPCRYTAMVISMIHGGTTDEDVLWH